MTDREALRQRLEARLRELSDRVERVSGDLRREPLRDWEEAAVEAENDEVLEGLDASGRNELSQIRAALARLDAGTYGQCAGCGEPIDARRLEALPYAIQCISCAS